ncbi:MAG: response regulator transcription factor [Firmicutes bacterium]|nr:response regulator transcription factor [Bacillota bacterium]
MYRVLLVDDDPHIQKTNEAYLNKLGYHVSKADNGSDALKAVSSAAFDAIVLDVDMPGIDGFTICRRIREVSGVPIIFLSAYAKTDDRIRGLIAGGDDYLGKPYSLTELELRIRLRIRRRHNIEMRDVLCFGELEIDLGLREVRYQGNISSFTALEFDLLAFLAQNPGQVFSYEQLYDRVWKAPVNKGVHNMQVCMARVRQKLELLCPGIHYIETVRRKGYRFRQEDR